MTVKAYAHIVDKVVLNVSLWDGATEYTDTADLVEIPTGLPVGIGWRYIDGEWIEAPDPFAT